MRLRKVSCACPPRVRRAENSLNASRGERSKPHRWAFLARTRARARQGACRERLGDRGCQPRVRGKIAVRLTVAAEARAHALAAGLAEPGAEVGILEQAVGLCGQLLTRAAQDPRDPVLDQPAVAPDVGGEDRAAPRQRL